jgi:myo-inositol catabolism protein IolC
MSGLDVGGVEYMVDDRDGRARFYDLNAMSNFVAKPLEVLDGKLLYALALDGAGSTFDLCPADVCMVDKPTITISQYEPPAELTQAVEKVARMSGLDVGGVEYMIDDRDGRAKFYDLNAMSNFVAKPLEVLGWDPHDRLVDYLLPLIAAQGKAAA